MAEVREDPIRLALSAEGVGLRERACVPSARVRVGLLLNPKARRVREGNARAQLARLVGDRDAWYETHDLASLRRALAFLLCVRGANVLAVAGGDGTVHHTVNALVELGREAEALTGRRPPMPRLLILNGGTLNIVGRTVAIHGPPQRTLGRFLKYFEGAPLSRVPARRLPLLQVCWGELPASDLVEGEAEADRPRSLPAATAPRVGFVFGSETAFHALDLYARFGAGYLGLSRFLLEFARGATLGSDLWRAEAWKLGPHRHRLRVDDAVFEQYTAAVASTVDLTLAIGAVRTIRRPLLQPGFAVRVVDEADPVRLVAMLPALMTERGTAGVHNFAEARRLELFGPYTLDGECFSEPAVAAERLPLTVTESPERLHAVPGEWTAEEW